jgi:hypothetical protein
MSDSAAASAAPPSSFHSSIIETVHHVTLPQRIWTNEVGEFGTVSASWNDLPVIVHVLNFKTVNKIHPSFFPAVSKFKREIAASNQAKLVSINLNSEMLTVVRNAGMEQALGYLKGFKVMEQTPTTDTPDQIKTHFVRQIVDGARHALDVMFKITVAGDENFRETVKTLDPARFAAASSLAFAGPAYKAKLFLYMDRPLLDALAKLICPEGMDEATLQSMPSEILNIIYATARSKLNNDRGYRMPEAIPQITTAAAALLDRNLPSRQSMLLPFVTPVGQFYLEITAHE